jgi:hypothetical protein
VRGWLKGSIAGLMAALACAAMAPGAGAARQPHESEGIYLYFAPRKEVSVTVEVHPQLGFAAVWTEMGMSKSGHLRSRHGSVAYAVRIPKQPLRGRIDLQVPGVASIVGELSEVRERLEFDGSFHFHGNGGYLNFDASHAIAVRLKGARLCPEGCRRSDPDLFEYISFLPETTGQTSQVLYSEGRFGRRVNRFMATHTIPGRQATWEGQTLEWLPGRVAVIRSIELEKSAAAGFKVSSNVEHPKRATVRPPGPFSGSAVYRRSGGIRSPRSGELVGSLSVDLFGIKVPLAGPRAKASLINFLPGL